MFSFKTKIENWLLDEQSRWLLWVPLFIGCGIILYFTQNNAPIYSGLAMFFAGLPALVFWKTKPWLRAFLMFLLFLGIGFMAAQLQTLRFQQPLIKRSSHILPIEANLQEVINDDGKQKLVLSDIVIEGGTRYPIPDTIRLSLKKADERLMAGQRVKLRGGMFPLPSPAIPGGFDFTQYFYFKGIGAVGFALAPVEILQDKHHDSLSIKLANFRSAISKRITAAMQSSFNKETIAVSNALITGERAGIGDDTKDAMRAAGLAHMLAISGLHLGLVTGVFFVLFRYFLLFIPGLALHKPIKKWAAMGALLAGFGYLVIAGFPVSAQRAYVMVGLVLVAVMLDRQVMPMRSLALAAIIILLIFPASIMGPSFQLSFSATMSIIALYEVWRTKRAGKEKKPHRYGFSRKILLYVVGVLATTFVASLITSPYAVYHFNQFTNYHLLANMAASPVFSFMVMPAAVGAILLMPLGLEQPFMWLMAQGVEWVIAIATAVAAIPNSMLHVATPPSWAIAVVSFGACWLCFWRQRVRHIGWLIILVGTVPFFNVKLPDIIVSEKAEQIAVKIEDGGYAMLRGSVKNFKAGLWLEALGIEKFYKKDKLGSAYSCDGMGCLLNYNGKKVSFPKWREAAVSDCEISDAMITGFYHNCDTTIGIERPKQSVSLIIGYDTIVVNKSEPFISRLSAQD